MQRTITDGGGTFIDFDANLSNTQQLTDVQTLINQGAKVLVLLAQDDKAGAAAVKLATDNGIPVIAYDRLIEDPSVLYLSFNNTDVGVAEATAMLQKVPPGTTDKPANYVLIKGHPGDANAKTFLPAGWDQAGLKAAVDAGTIKILNNPPDGTFTDDWDTTKAHQQHGSHHRRRQRRPSRRSTRSWPRTTARRSASPTPSRTSRTATCPISGQDGDTANLQNVAAGIQYVDVWKDANQLGKAAGAAALQLCEDKTIANVKLPDGVVDAGQRARQGQRGPVDFTTPGGNTVKSLILKVQPITQDNLQKILDAKWLTKAVLCKNGDPAGPRSDGRRPSASRRPAQ